MTLKSGLAGQLGLKEETTWGTPVTVDRFYELVSESVVLDVERIESEGIRTGVRVQRSDDWTAGAQRVSGPIELELSTKNMALLFKHAMGAVNTTGAGPYTHSCTPGTLTGKGLTIQVGRPDVSGTVQPFTWAGCKVASWEVSGTVGELGKLSLDIVGKSQTTATALASASYTASNNLLSFVHGAATIAGASANVRSFTLSGDNALNADRYFLGADTTAEPLEAGMRQYTGTIELEFESLTAYNRFVNGTEAALVLSFTRSTDSITFTANARFDPGTPNLSGPDILSLSLPFKCIGSSTDASALTVAVVSSEATP